jgi:hypothetical protein
LILSTDTFCQIPGLSEIPDAVWEIGDRAKILPTYSMYPLLENESPLILSYPCAMLTKRLKIGRQEEVFQKRGKRKSLPEL